MVAVEPLHRLVREGRGQRGVAARPAVDAAEEACERPECGRYIRAARERGVESLRLPEVLEHQHAVALVEAVDLWADSLGVPGACPLEIAGLAHDPLGRRLVLREALERGPGLLQDVAARRRSERRGSSHPVDVAVAGRLDADRFVRAGQAEAPQVGRDPGFGQ